MSKLYVAYGSNMNLEQMAMRCPNAKMIGLATLQNYRLLFRGERKNAVATIEPKKGGVVPVVVWEISPDDEKALDRYEGFPSLYRKKKIKANLCGSTISAMVYVMNDGRPLGTPSCYYYSIIYAGYKGAGFDMDILRSAVSESNGGEKNG